MNLKVCAGAERVSVCGYYPFDNVQFCSAEAVVDLCKAVEKDQYQLTLKSKPRTIEWLNEILRTANFYDLWFAKEKNQAIALDLQTQKLIRSTQLFRHLDSGQFWVARLNQIGALARALLVASYPDKTPTIQIHCTFPTCCLELKAKYKKLAYYNFYMGVNLLTNIYGFRTPFPLENSKVRNKITQKEVWKTRNVCWGCDEDNYELTDLTKPITQTWWERLLGESLETKRVGSYTIARKKT